MNTEILVTLSLAYGIALGVSTNASSQTTGVLYWPQWRGPQATGVSLDATPPLEWSETKNIRWKIEIPGRGSASPVVWGDKIRSCDRRKPESG